MDVVLILVSARTRLLASTILLVVDAAILIGRSHPKVEALCGWIDLSGSGRRGWRLHLIERLSWKVEIGDEQGKHCRQKR